MKLNKMTTASGNQIDRARQILASKPNITADEFYQEIVLESGLFEEAYELFPFYNSRQSMDASAYIMDQIEQGLDLENGPRWPDLRDEVYDMVVAGLT
jgi:NTP pyrophosphatase (non-canonical NTP hydrolase)